MRTISRLALAVILSALAITSFSSAVDLKQIYEGESATISWTVANAPSCSPTTDYNGSTNPWLQWEGSGDKAATGELPLGPFTTPTTEWKIFSCTYLPTGATDYAKIMVCPSATTWNGVDTCVWPSLGNLDGTDCTIAAGGSTCSNRITWSVLNSKNPYVYKNATVWTQSATGDLYQDFGTSGPGSNTVRLWDGADLHTITVNKSCASGTSWNGSICQYPIAGTLSLTPESCTIPLDASTCPADLTWTVSYTTGYLMKGTTNLDSMASGGNRTRTESATNGTVTYYVRDGSASGTVLAQGTLTGSCASGSTWNGTKCDPNQTTVEVTGSPDGINYGENLDSIGYTTTNATQCSFAITGQATNNNAPLSWSATAYGPLTQTTTFTTTCSNGGFKPTTDTYTVTVCTADYYWDEASGTCKKRPPLKVSFNAAGCVIPFDGTTCNTTVDWKVKYPVDPRVYMDGVFSNSWNQYQGNMTYAFSDGPGNHTYTLWDQAVMDTKTVTKTCAPGSGWYNGKCTVPTPETQPFGWVTASPAVCEIAANQSSCSSTIAWGVSDVVEGVLVDEAGRIRGQSDIGGSFSETISIGDASGGMKTYTLRNGNTSGAILATANLRAACVQGTNWNGAKCALPPEANLSINPLVCYVQENQSSCTSTVSWSTQDTPSAVLVDSVSLSVLQSGTSGSYSKTLSLSGSGIAYATFSVRNGNANGKILAEDTMTAVCSSNTFWSGAKCVTDIPIILIPDGSISLTPSVCQVPAGYSSCSVSVSWTTQNTTFAELVNGSNQVIQSGTGGNIVRTVTMTSGPAGYADFRVRNGDANGTVLAFASARAECAQNTAWSSTMSKCVSPDQVCPTGTEWSGTACVSYPASGSLSINPPVCYVQENQSSCTSAISWSTQNTTRAVLVDGSNQDLQTGTGGSYSKTLSLSGSSVASATFSVRNGNANGQTLAQDTMNAKCVSGTLWKAGKCVFPDQETLLPEATIDISPGTCEIQPEESSCSSTIDWTILNSALGVLVNEAGQVLQQSSTGGSVSASLSYVPGVATYRVRDGSASGPILASAQMSVVCSYGTSWDGTKCAPPPPPPPSPQPCECGYLFDENRNMCVLIDEQCGFGMQMNAEGTCQKVTEAPFCPDTSTSTPPTPTGAVRATRCTIGSNLSTCSFRVTWNIQNAATPMVYIDGSVSNRYLGASGTKMTGAEVPSGFTPHTFTAYDANSDVQLGTSTVSRVCAANTLWDGTKCAPAAGQLTSNTPLCTITSGASSCSGTLSYSTQNTLQASVWRHDTAATRVATGTSGGITVTGITPDGKMYKLHNSNKVTGLLLDSLEVSAVCEADSGWDGTKCAPASGELTASPLTCRIPAGASTCSSDITFTADNTDFATVWDMTDPLAPSVFLGGQSNSGTYSGISRGTKTLVLINGNQETGKELDRVVLTGTCAAGTLWNGAICEAAQGTLSADPQQCFIPLGETYCSSSIRFTAAGTDNAKVFVQGNATPIMSGLSGTATYDRITLGGKVFVLNNAASDGDTTQLASVNVSGTCGGVNEWENESSMCVDPTPVIEVEYSPRAVPYNGALSISWKIKYPNNTCKLEASLSRPSTCNAACQAEIAANEEALNADLSSGSTNQNDPSGRRTMTDALTDEITGDFAKGVKTINLQYSTEFNLTCDPGPGRTGTQSQAAKPIKTIIYVTEKNEG